MKENAEDEREINDYVLNSMLEDKFMLKYGIELDSFFNSVDKLFLDSKS